MYECNQRLPLREAVTKMPMPISHAHVTYSRLSAPAKKKTLSHGIAAVEVCEFHE
jgi:hypothetical protein